ncbi:5-hydroxyisourate hydrolase-like isoform X1 [Synchiropus splendidus]|uniref:5-hydroxyisourate hydrolase-like isoform X1 n=2 Tax=Synchiropus splendidus TaxID=270530 RepID=UPI00237E38AE|nr:5-hydroxyisourate hydrolase-like isoform X1 [Synchiropus splendidus]
MNTLRLQTIKGQILLHCKNTAMAVPPSPLTTHVLNIVTGIPVADMALSLYGQDASTKVWNLITTGVTNSQGRCPGLITKEMFQPGMYKIRFETELYWESLGETSFYPYVEYVFAVGDAEQQYHLPLLLSRFSYTTYRGNEAS